MDIFLPSDFLLGPALFFSHGQSHRARRFNNVQVYLPQGKKLNFEKTGGSITVCFYDQKKGHLSIGAVGDVKVKWKNEACAFAFVY